MQARITIEYDESISGEGSISIITETDPPLDITGVYWLGLLELSKKYILEDWEQGEWHTE